MGDSDAVAMFGYVVRELGKRTGVFIAARESLGDQRLGPQLKAAFSGPYMANEKFTRQSAQQVLDAGEAVALAWVSCLSRSGAVQLSVRRYRNSLWLRTAATRTTRRVRAVRVAPARDCIQHSPPI
jgi:hypothetical protein